MGILSCSEASQLSSDSLDRSLSIREHIEWIVHLLLCKACRLYRRQIRQLQGALPEVFLPFDESAGLREEKRKEIQTILDQNL